MHDLTGISNRQTSDWHCSIFIALSAFLFMQITATSTAIAVELSGRVEVIDGDTVDIGGVRIRLYGIDAPEVGQRCLKDGGKSWRCGIQSSATLEGLAEGKTLTCVGEEWDDFDRLVAVCRVNGKDLNAEMIRLGMAWAFVKYSRVYVDVETSARAARIGVWQGQTQPPWEYRAQRWIVAEQKSPDGCPIKGNISKNGKIYHTPWSRSYKGTRINLSKGERWFCSEREALDAGWRAPRWR